MPKHFTCMHCDLTCTKCSKHLSWGYENIYEWTWTHTHSPEVKRFSMVSTNATIVAYDDGDDDVAEAASAAIVIVVIIGCCCCCRCQWWLCTFVRWVGNGVAYHAMPCHDIEEVTFSSKQKQDREYASYARSVVVDINDNVLIQCSLWIMKAIWAAENLAHLAGFYATFPFQIGR